MRRPAAILLALLLPSPLLSACGSPSGEPSVVRRERIAQDVLVINLDDLRHDGMDRMPVLQTRLVPRAAVFTNAFTTTPVCCPSRASLLTGLRTSHHQVLSLGGPEGGAHRFRERGGDRATVATWFRDAGFETALVGKYLNGYDAKTELAAPGRLYVPPGWSVWRAMVSPEVYGGLGGRDWSITRTDGSIDVMDQHADDSQYSTDVTGRLALEAMQAAYAAQRRFFVYWAPVAPHAGDATIAPKPAARHKGAMADLPPHRPPSFLEADRSDKPAHTRAGRTSPFDEAFTDGARRLQYETLLAVDERLADLLDWLEQTPGRHDPGRSLFDETAIVFTSDHGVQWGENGFRGLAKTLPYEASIRIPLVVKTPENQHRVIPEPALVVDIAPTVLELAGVPVPPGLDGRSLVPLLDGRVPPDWRTDFLLEYWPWMAPKGAATPAWRAVRDVGRRQLYVEYATGEQELYDLATDPFEMESRHADPAFATRRAELAARLAELSR